MPIDLKFRPAQASDANIAVPLIYSSGPVACDYVFASKNKGNGEAFMHYAFLDGAGEFGYHNHIVGTVDDEVVCIGAGFTGETGMAFMLNAIRQIFVFYKPLQALNVIRKGLLIEQIVKPPAKDLYYIGHLGVIPDCQGQGIGTQLLSHLIDTAQNNGHTEVALDVALSNPRAQALYEREGFVVTELCKSNLGNQWGTVPDHHRIERKL